MRRNDHDVTDRIRTTDLKQVSAEVLRLYRGLYNGTPRPRDRARLRGPRTAVRRRAPGLPALRHRIPRHPARARRDARHGAPDGRLRAQPAGNALARRRLAAAAGGLLFARRHHRAVPRFRLPAQARRPPAPLRRRVHAHARHARLAPPAALPAAHRPEALCERGRDAGALHRLRAPRGNHPARGQAAAPRRAHARHRRHHRADGRPLLPRKMPRPPLSGIRAGRPDAKRSSRAAARRYCSAPATTWCARRRAST